MDQHTRWLRNRITRSILAKCAQLWLVVTATGIGVAVIQFDMTIIDAGPWAVIGGQTVAGAGLLITVLWSPLNYRFLSSYVADDSVLAPTRDPQGEPHPNVELLQGFQLLRLVAVDDRNSGDGSEREPSEATETFDVLQSRNQLVTAGVNRSSGSITLTSRLSDGRILLTSDLIAPPTSALIVNTAPSGDVEAIIARHRAVLVILGDTGNGPRVDDGRVFVDAMIEERAAYAELGPVLGSFLQLEPTMSPHRFAVKVNPDELLQRSL